jgi:hypothetical protein
MTSAYKKSACCAISDSLRIDATSWGVTMFVMMGAYAGAADGAELAGALNGPLKLSANGKYVGVFEYEDGGYIYRSATGGAVADKRIFSGRCPDNFQWGKFSTWSDDVEKLFSRQPVRFELTQPRENSHLFLYFRKRLQSESAGSSTVQDLPDFAVWRREYGVLRLKRLPGSVAMLRDKVTGTVSGVMPKSILGGGAAPGAGQEETADFDDLPAEGVIVLALIGYYFDALAPSERSLYQQWFGGAAEQKGPRRGANVVNIETALAAAFTKQNKSEKIIELLRVLEPAPNSGAEQFGPFHKKAGSEPERDIWETRFEEAASGEKRKALYELIDIVFSVIFEDVHKEEPSGLSSYLGIEKLTVDAPDAQDIALLDAGKSLQRGVELYKQGKAEEARVYLANAYARGGPEATGRREAMYYLGLTYNPNLVYPDRKCEEALGIAMVKWAAEHGAGEAQYRLGVIYELGLPDVLPSDLNLALEWTMQAKANGVTVPASRIDALYTKMTQKPDEKSWYQGDLFRQVAKDVSVGVASSLVGPLGGIAVGIVVDHH